MVARYSILQKLEYPFLLLAAMLAAYSLQFAGLGFYWDDWQAVFLAKINRPQIYWNYFLYDRPFSAWTYILTVPLLGTNPTAWHFFTLGIRWLGILALCRALNDIWPGRRWQIRWIGLLLGVFPGFHQQWVSVAYSQHFITFSLFTLSLALMTTSLRQTSRFSLFMPAAVVCSLLQLMTMEYFAGLELLRPGLIYLLLSRVIDKPLKRLAKTALHWIPYLVPAGCFIAWRFFFYTRIRPVPEDYLTPFWQKILSTPVSYLIVYTTRFLQELLHVSLFSWLEPIGPDTILLNSRLFYFCWGVGLAAAAGIACFMCKVRAENIPPEGRPAPPFHLPAALTGLLAVFFGGIPIWATNHQSTLGMWSDRFTLPLMIGAALLLVTGIDWLIDSRVKKVILLAIIVGLAITSHNRTANRYRLDWNNQRNYYWQLYWRAPGLKNGTAVLAPELPVTFESDYSLGFAVNLIYAHPNLSPSVPYWWVYANPAGSPLIPVFDKDRPISYHDFRNIRFDGSTSNGIMVVRNFDSDCLIVLSPPYQGLPRLALSPEMFNVSNETQIETDPQKADSPPVTIFGPQPEREWCYYFEKADLAMQAGDWKTIIILDEDARRNGVKPANGAELVPFIIGYARMERWEQAAGITREMRHLHNTRYSEDPVEYYLCRLWEKLETDTPDSTDRQKWMISIKNEMDCGLLVSP